MPGEVGPKGLAELPEGPGRLLGRGAVHAPVGRPQSVMRLPQGCCPPTAQFSRLELSPMGRPEVYPTHLAFANTF